MRSLKIFVIVYFIFCFTSQSYADVRFTVEKPTESEKITAEKFFTIFKGRILSGNWIKVKEMIFTDSVKEGSGYWPTPSELKRLFIANQRLISHSAIWMTEVKNYSLLDDASDIYVYPNELKRISIIRKGRFVSLYLEYKSGNESKPEIEGKDKRYSKVTVNGIAKNLPYLELQLIPVPDKSGKIIYKIFNFRIIEDGTRMIGTDKC